jgi:maltooligosyltrehalose trehalohydrolase
MLFMGEEYGENAPFQFFSDHIDEEIATATREGRRREFAAFKQFGEEIPDPQAESTFLASKLTRDEDPQITALYEQLLGARRELRGLVSGIEWDEEEKWLRVVRGGHDLVMNFSDRRALVPCAGDDVVVTTAAANAITDEGIELEPLSGALVR